MQVGLPAIFHLEKLFLSKDCASLIIFGDFLTGFLVCVEEVWNTREAHLTRRLDMSVDKRGIHSGVFQEVMASESALLASC